MQVNNAEIVIVAADGLIELRTKLGSYGVWKSLFLKASQAEELVGQLLSAIKAVK